MKKICGLSIAIASLIASLAPLTVSSAPLMKNPAKAALGSSLRVYATYDETKSIGRVYIARGGHLSTLVEDSGVKYLPIISPLGDRVAFLRVEPYDIADGELDIIDLSGRYYSKTLFNYNPKMNPSIDPNTQYPPMRNIESIEWLGPNESRIAIVGEVGPAVNIGYVIPLPSKPSTVVQLYPAKFDPAQIAFEDDGPSAISPSLLHIASVGGGQTLAEYKVCTDARENLQIDGTIILLPKNAVFVAPFSWRDDTELSTIVRTADGFEILHVNNIPSKFEFKSPLSENDPGPPLNPPTIEFQKIPIKPSEVRLASFDGNYMPDGRFVATEYLGAAPKHPMADWVRGEKGIPTRYDNVEAFPDPRADNTNKQNAADAALGKLDPALPNSEPVSSSNIWCRGDACGSLYAMPARAAIEDFGVKVPAPCAPEPK